MADEEAKGKDEQRGKGPCPCPYCDAPVEKVYPFCKDCGKKIRFCSKCGKPIPPHMEICADCRG